MKYKLTNNTKLNIWIENYCFRPGQSTFEPEAETLKSIESALENNKELALLKKNKLLLLEEEKAPLKK